MTNIFLIGFMGSGKTSVGKHLAELLKSEFVDLDEVLEKNEGKTISQIFANRGEDLFRERESQCLKSFAGKANLVIATGGGTPCFHDNLKWMNENGVTIYLKTDPDILFYRLKGEISHRPLLANYSEEELKKFIESKLLERSSFYNSSKIILNTEEMNAKEIAEKIRAIAY